jgi:hypothetical protein
MDERTDQGRNEGHPRVHDYDPNQEESNQEERRSNGGSEKGRGKSRVRFLDEKPDVRSTASQNGGQQAEKRVSKAGNELSSFAGAWTDTGSVAFATAAYFFLSWQRQTAAFCGMRLDKDLQFGRRLVEVRDPAAWVRLNSEYVREAVSDYTSSLSDLTMQSARDAQQKGYEVFGRAEKAAEHLRASAEHAAGRD